VNSFDDGWDSGGAVGVASSDAHQAQGYSKPSAKIDSLRTVTDRAIASLEQIHEAVEYRRRQRDQPLATPQFARRGVDAIFT